MHCVCFSENNKNKSPSQCARMVESSCTTTNTKRAPKTKAQEVCVKSEICLIEHVKNIVSALQNIIKDPTANTVPGKNSAVALNNEPNETGPAPKRQHRFKMSCKWNRKQRPVNERKGLAYGRREGRHEPQCCLHSALKIALGAAGYNGSNGWENLWVVSRIECS